MRSLLWSLRVAAVVTLVFGVASLFASERSLAVPLSFDYTTGNPIPVATITGTGGTMDFSLDVADPGLSDRSGNFAMDVFSPGDVLLGSISLIGAPSLNGGSFAFGSIAWPPGVAGGLPNISTWSLTVVALDLPLTLVVTSILFDALGNPFAPLLTVDFTGDLALATNAVPLPATLPLFATGIGMMGLLGWRRKRKGVAPGRVDKLDPAAC